MNGSRHIESLADRSLDGLSVLKMCILDAQHTKPRNDKGASERDHLPQIVQKSSCLIILPLVFL